MTHQEPEEILLTPSEALQLDLLKEMKSYYKANLPISFQQAFIKASKDRGSSIVRHAEKAPPRRDATIPFNTTERTNEQSPQRS